MERTARWILRLAGIYGLLVLAPFYFLERQIGIEQPPPITHPEYFYGFAGVALAWQVAFLIMATDPRRYRLLLLPSALEKFSFGIATVILRTQGRLARCPPGGRIIDLICGSSF
ncbi:MAG: hypothetical protein U0872_03875 [Planctomycetaceae bacterium]